MNNLKVYDSSEQLEGLRFKVVEVLFGNDFLKFKYRKQHVVHNLLFCFQLSGCTDMRARVVTYMDRRQSVSAMTMSTRLQQNYNS